MDWIGTYILPFILLLGILVFVHEAGHFTLAKLFGITVERFSIGFGPRIVGTTRGGTEYRISWVPLGGYVKMAGDDPSDEAARTRPGSFLGSSLWKRWLVVLAGPGVNLILPIFVYAGLFMHGEKLPAAFIGQVRSGSPAQKAGLRAGDEVLAIDGQPVQTWNDLRQRIAGAPGEVTIAVERDSHRLEFHIPPEMHDSPDEFGVVKPTPQIGVTNVAPLAVVEPVPGSPAEKAGIKPGDRIVKLGDREVKFLDELGPALAALPPGKVGVGIERPTRSPDPAEAAKGAHGPPQKLSLEMEVPASPSLDRVGLRDGQLVVFAVEPDSPAFSAGFQPGDRLLSVGGKPPAGIIDYAPTPTPLPVTLERDDKQVSLTLTAITREMPIAHGMSRKRPVPYDGLEFAAQLEVRRWFLLQYRNPFSALGHGVLATGEVIGANVRAIGKIFTHEIRLRDAVGGPVAIADATGSAVKEAGWEGFIEILVQMSVILGLMNLLPIPILDGGHLAFFLVEGVTRRPPSLRVREMAQQAGLLLLLAVMAFVLVNDVITRL